MNWKAVIAVWLYTDSVCLSSGLKLLSCPSIYLCTGFPFTLFVHSDTCGQAEAQRLSIDLCFCRGQRDVQCGNSYWGVFDTGQYYSSRTIS